MSKLFRNSMFGYNKKDVNGYIERISEEFQQQIDQAKEEIKALENKKTEIYEMREKLEKEKAAISEAILSAHEKADKIISEARQKADEARKESEQRIAAESSKLAKIRREIFNIRRNAIKTLSSLEADESEASEE